ncbi:hypothetical protein DFR37_10688 [Eoetvoesiella caeni]|uniref:Uncharacterized protein n=2 Tax=Eoetvoesiella caeni TaxID=645616 RepID=A0A366HAP8_9BURK|nr:hypothetical protein DFR37_10688 [Eoetvoesiella caeni]
MLTLTLNQNEQSDEVFNTPDAVALEEAARAMRAIRGFAGDLGARAALILASQVYPDDALAVAAKKLAAEFNALRAQAKAIATKAEILKQAENERLSKWTGPVIDRLGEIRQRIEWIHRCIEENRLRDSKRDSRAADLRRQGVSEAEIKRLRGTHETTEALLAQKAVLEAEREKLHLFQKTGDTALLPKHIHPRIRIEPPRSALDSDAKAMVENSVIG